ncbi:hypothetical protein, partial [Streptomyces venezuelae]|uniref:hypothetical protein n=2 Tax=Streptomyces venezuelae TaxID=54571 RepID=UPI001F22E066
MTEPVLQEPGRMVDRYGLGRKVRGQGPGDLGGRRGAGEPGLDGGHEALDVSGGEQQPGVGEPEAGEEVGGRAGGRLLRRPVSYTHLRAHATQSYVVCCLMLSMKT